MQPILQLNQPQPREAALQFKNPLQWELLPQQQWAIVGANGAGKTTFANILRGAIALKGGSVTLHLAGKSSELIKLIEFKDIHSLSESRESYYQQRFHATENEEVPTVQSLLHRWGTPEVVARVVQTLSLEPQLGKRLVYLSSGELRKFLIARALLHQPRILILDNPYIGLDASSRILLDRLFEQLAATGEVQLILLLSAPHHIPTAITHILPLASRCTLPPVERATFLADTTLHQQLFPEWEVSENPLPHPTRIDRPHTVAVAMEHLNASYGEKQVLTDINWRIERGEKWALLGENGSGKSTLLSMIFADHPQSYANTLYLFDRRRGTGESIWEIKERIGYVSPEMHLYYRENVPALEIVASGFFDTVGLYRKCSPTQLATAQAWMESFQIAHLQERRFLTLSSGEQRLVLLARAFVKEPDLLILDEPLHGLDSARKAFVLKLIENYCAPTNKTLIYVTHYLEELPPCITQHFKLQRSR